MRAGVCAVALACAAALPAGGAAATVTGTPQEPPPVKLWSEFPLVPPAQPAPGGVARVQSETERVAPAAAFPTDSGAVPSTLLLALLLGNALFVGGTAILVLRRRARRPAPASATARAAVPARDEVAPRPRAAVLAASVGRDRVGACEIAFRQGGDSSRFYARPVGSAGSSALPLALSPPFALGPGGALDQTEEARAAFEELVGALAAAGWEPSRDGDQWFERRFRRT
jgi:hypothetical protein